jgi:hypothetical protein
MYSIKNLANKSLKKDLLEQFLEFANDKLAIDKPYSVYFVNDKENASDALGKTAMYNPSTNSVYVYVTNRHPKDILRSIAHELMHHKQNCEGRLDKTYGEGSDDLENLELEANEAGYLVRQFEDGLKENKLKEVYGPGAGREKAGGSGKTSEEKPSLPNFLFDLGYVDYVYPDWLLKLDQKLMRKLVREPGGLYNTELPERKEVYISGQPGIPIRKPLPASRGYDKPTYEYAAYSKCLPHQEKRKDGRCYPKGFSSNKKFYDFDGLTKDDFLLIAKDIKLTNAANRDSVFKGQEKSLQFALIIMPKLIRAFKTIKAAKPVPEDYINIRNRNVKELKKLLNLYLEKIEKLKKDIEIKPSEIERLGSYIKLENINEQEEKASSKFKFNKNDPFYSQYLINDARRLYILFKTGKFEHGPEENPFIYQQEIPKDIIDSLKAKYGFTVEDLPDGQISDLTKANEIYRSNASSKAATPEDKEVMEVIHFMLDILGMSPDAFGFGIAADLLNALIYFVEKDYFNAIMSFAAAALFGDVVKVRKGPLRQLANMAIDFKRGAQFVINVKALGALEDSAEIFINWLQRFVGRVDAFMARGGTEGGLRQKFFQSIREKFAPGLKSKIDDYNKVLDDFKEYNKQLRVLKNEMREGLNPNRVSALLKNEDNQIQVVAEVLQNRANEAARGTKGGKLSGTKVEPTVGADYKTKLDAAQKAKNKAQIDLDNYKKEQVPGYGRDVDAPDPDLERLQNNLDSTKADLEKIGVEGKPNQSALAQAAKLKSENPGVFEEILNDLRDSAAGLNIPNTFTKSMVDAVNKSGTTSVRDSIDVARKYMNENYDDFVLKQISLNADSGSLRKLLDRETRTLYGPDAVRALKAGTAKTRAVAAPFLTIIKQFLGYGGALGEIYKVFGLSGVRLWKRQILNLTTMKGWARLPKSVFITYLFSLPFFILGKLALFVNYYVRYYRNWCGDSQSYIAIITPIMESIFNSWSSILKSIVSPLQTFEEASVFIDKMNELHYNQESKIDTVLDYIVEGTTNAFSCKKKAKNLDALQLIRNNKKLKKTLTELEAEVQKLAAQEAAISSKKVHNKGREFLTTTSRTVDAAKQEVTSTVDAVKKSLQQGKVTPQLQEKYNKFSNAVREVTGAKDTTPEEKKAAQQLGRGVNQAMQKSGYAVNPDDFPELKESKNENTNESLSDYRKKVLEERLVKLTIGLTK